MKINIGDSVNNVLLIKKAELKSTKNGNRYVDMRLCDKENEYPAKYWDYPYEELNFGPLTLQRIVGKAEAYSGNLQIVVSAIFPVDMSVVNLSEFVPTAPINSEVMLEYIHKVVDNIKNPDLQKLTYFMIEGVEPEFMTYPAAVSCHDAVRSGLIHHTYKMLKSAQAIHGIYPSIDIDLLSAGIILHDIAKVKELEASDIGIASSYTVQGNLLGHLVMGAIDVAECGRVFEIDPEVVMLVVHMLISHHGKPEYGAAKTPMLLEAQVLNLLDDLDAKVYEFTEVIDSLDPGEMSQKIFSLGNIMVYNPNI